MVEVAPSDSHSDGDCDELVSDASRIWPAGPTAWVLAAAPPNAHSTRRALSVGGCVGAASRTKRGRLAMLVAGESLGTPSTASRAAAPLRHGPADAELLFRWPADYFAALKARGLEDIVWLNLKNGIDLETDYSGAGSVENAAGSIGDYATSISPFGDPIRGLNTLRSCDHNNMCQHVLRSSVGVASYACVFRDIRERVPTRILAQLEAVVAAHEELCSHALAQPCVKAIEPSSGPSCEKVCSQATPNKPDAALRSLELDLWALQWCTKHDKLCSLTPERNPDSLLVWVGGLSCLDCSSMGKRSAWNGDGCIRYLIWLFHVLAARPHVVIECTPLFDIAFVCTILEPMYFVMAMKLCPAMLGAPCRRLRLWIVCVLVGEVDVSYRLDSQEFADIFLSKAARVSGGALAGHRGGEERHKGDHSCGEADAPDDLGKPWPTADLLPKGAQIRLRGYQMIHRETKKCQQCSTMLVDVNQNPDKVCSIGIDEVHFLSRRSKLLALRCRGVPLPDNDPVLITPQEHLAIMGWPPHEGTLVRHALRN